MDRNFLLECRAAVACQARGDSGTAMVKETVARQHLKQFSNFGDERGAYEWVCGELALGRGDSRAAAKILLGAIKRLRRSKQAEAENASLLVDVYATLGRASLRNGRYQGAVQAMKVSMRRAARVDGANSWPRLLAVTPRLCGALYLAEDETADRVLEEGYKRTAENFGPEEKRAYITQAVAMLHSLGRAEKADAWQELLAEPVAV